MDAVVLCRLPRPDTAVEERLFDLAGLTLPQAGVDFLFSGIERGGAVAILIALRFAKRGAADAFRLLAEGLPGVTATVVHLHATRAGGPSAPLFP